jgi:hypothetical protein
MLLDDEQREKRRRVPAEVFPSPNPQDLFAGRGGHGFGNMELTGEKRILNSRVCSAQRMRTPDFVRIARRWINNASVVGIPYLAVLKAAM